MLNPFDLQDLNRDGMVDAADLPLIQDRLTRNGYGRFTKATVTSPSGVNTIFDLDHSVAKIGSLLPEGSMSTLR